MTLIKLNSDLQLPSTSVKKQDDHVKSFKIISILILINTIYLLNTFSSHNYSFPTIFPKGFEMEACYYAIIYFRERSLKILLDVNSATFISGLIYWG